MALCLYIVRVFGWSNEILFGPIELDPIESL